MYKCDLTYELIGSLESVKYTCSWFLLISLSQYLSPFWDAMLSPITVTKSERAVRLRLQFRQIHMLF